MCLMFTRIWAQQSPMRVSLEVFSLVDHCRVLFACLMPVLDRDLTALKLFLYGTLLTHQFFILFTCLKPVNPCACTWSWSDCPTIIPVWDPSDTDQCLMLFACGAVFSPLWLHNFRLRIPVRDPCTPDRTRASSSTYGTVMNGTFVIHVSCDYELLVRDPIPRRACWSHGLYYHLIAPHSWTGRRFVLFIWFLSGFRNGPLSQRVACRDTLVFVTQIPERDSRVASPSRREGSSSSMVPRSEPQQRHSTPLYLGRDVPLYLGSLNLWPPSLLPNKHSLFIIPLKRQII